MVLSKQDAVVWFLLFFDQLYPGPLFVLWFGKHDQSFRRFPLPKYAGNRIGLNVSLLHARTHPRHTNDPSILIGSILASEKLLFERRPAYLVCTQILTVSSVSVETGTANLFFFISDLYLLTTFYHRWYTLVLPETLVVGFVKFALHLLMYFWSKPIFCQNDCWLAAGWRSASDQKYGFWPMWY